VCWRGADAEKRRSLQKNKQKTKLKTDTGLAPSPFFPSARPRWTQSRHSSCVYENCKRCIPYEAWRNASDEKASSSCYPAAIAEEMEQSPCKPPSACGTSSLDQLATPSVSRQGHGAPVILLAGRHVQRGIRFLSR